jgi:hypothetical protein
MSDEAREADKWEALYLRDRWDILDRMRNFIVEYYGQRCQDFDADCLTCKLWKLRDEFEQNADK